MSDPITEEIREVDWSVDLPTDAAGTVVAGLRRRRTRRRRVAVGLVCVTTAGIMAAVPLLAPSVDPRPGRGGAPPAVSGPSAFSQIPAVTLARLHRVGYVVTPPTSTPKVTEQQAISTTAVCGGQSLAACGEPRAYLVDMRDDFADGPHPVARTYWVFAFPPTWRPMVSCGPAPLPGVKRRGSCESYSVLFEWIDAETGKWAGADLTSVHDTNAPPPP